MNFRSNKIQILSGNVLKIIALITMTIDHIGGIMFPSAIWFRIVGRVAFPIFAYMIAEGCFYTKSRKRYLSMVLALGVVCQLVFWFAEKNLYQCILVTFSLSIILIYLLDTAFNYTLSFYNLTRNNKNSKDSVINENYDNLLRSSGLNSETNIDVNIEKIEPVSNFGDKIKKTSLTKVIGLWIAFAAALAAVYAITMIIPKQQWSGGFAVDYGFFGVLLPVLVYIPYLIVKEKRKEQLRAVLKWLLLAAGLAPVALTITLRVQWWSYLALIPLLLYSGRRGRLRMKYLFYIYYPAHLGIIYLVSSFLVL